LLANSVDEPTTTLPATAPKAGARRRRRYIPWLVVLLGIAATTGSFLTLHNNERAQLDAEFKRRAQGIANLMAEALRNRQEALLTMQNLFHYSEEVTRSEFDRAASDLLARHPGLQSLKWAPRVSAAQREKFEAAAQSDNLSDYKIFAAARPAGPSSANLASESFPIFYDVSADAATHALGFDLATSSAWPDFQLAAREGSLRASGRVPHITSESIGDAYLIELPVYLDAVPRTEEARASLLRGFLLGVFQPSSLLENLATQLPRTGLDVLLVERVGENEVYPLYYRPFSVRANGTAVPRIEDFKTELFQCIELPFAGRNWEMWFRPDPEWLDAQDSPDEYVIACFGLLITALLAICLHALFRQTSAVELVVAQRTAELTATQCELRKDIQHRILVEQALKAGEERYRLLVSQSADAIWRLELPVPVPVSLPVDEQIERLTTTGLIAECNKITAQMYGHKQAADILGQKLSFLPPRSRQRHESVLRAFVNSGYSLSDHESSDTAPDGEPRIFTHNLIGILEHNQLARIWVTERELTKQRLLEQEKKVFEHRLGETQRLESLGVLAGGIAHDFNNLLTGILGHASLGRSEILEDSPLNSHFEEIEIASRNAANLCQQMLAYAGKGRFVVKPHNLSQIVSQAAHLLHISLSKQAELRFQLAEGLPLVLADATQIQQIVMNLVINASEAIGKRPGLIALTTRLIQPDASTFSSCPYAPEKPAAAYVTLEVRDNGAGMSPEVIERIFEPFFTTKFAGRGLGLAAALGIVRSHNGAVRVESKQGEGSTFTVFLPATDLKDKEENNHLLTHTPWSADGTLLVIDDEAPVRSVTERMAQALGFSALCAADGDQGIQLFQLYRAGIKVVLLDLSMPGLSGEETLASLRSIDPTIRVILMSGYNQPELPATINGKPPSFLSKPFSISQFQSAVRQAMLHDD
jgi:signal transduction histidine kinase/ActR/RegA family two-component response regulator